MVWNFGDMLEAVDEVVPPGRLAFAHGARTLAWGELARRSNNLARAFVEAGAGPGDKLALYMRNRPEYLEALAAGWKARLTHVNVNYRYTPEEVFYIFDDSDAAVVVYGAEFRPAVAAIAHRLPGVRLWVEVEDAGAAAREGARGYEALAAAGDGAPLKLRRSPTDEFFIYTGGTTGMPKGVMWTHGDLREIGQQAARALGPVPETMPDFRAAIAAEAAPHTRVVCGPPLMHGTGLLTSMTAMLNGGFVATLPGAHFEPREMLDAVDRWQATTVVVVGDAFARPLLEALDADSGRWDVSSVQVMVSSGVMWSLEVKRGLLRHMPQAVLQDAFSSSEAIGMGVSLMTKDAEVSTARFRVGERCRVLDAEDRDVAPGSGEAGVVALKGPNPLGYYKDAEKTARTFRTLDGERYAIPGDFARVEADGSLTLLGRGSACINTAGEKVYPEEVEEALKTHASVEDALVVGLPDPRWGQAITGVVRLRPGATLDGEALRRHVRDRLAPYKAPKAVFATTAALRAPNGKADYKAALAEARRMAAAGAG